jgi:hypothetical protein
MKRRIAIFTLLAAAPSTSQNTFRGNNAHTGVYQGAGPKQLGGVKWTFKAGGPIVTSPAIADGVVYFGAMDGHLHAVGRRPARRSGSSSRGRPSRRPRPSRAGWSTSSPRRDRKAVCCKVLNADASLNKQAFVPIFGDFQDM